TITAFAVPDPDRCLAAQSVFSGLAVPPGRPLEPITQLTSNWLLLCLPVLFCRRQARSYSRMRNCQRSRFVQTPLIFVWESFLLSYTPRMDCRAWPRNVHGQFTSFSPNRST